LHTLRATVADGDVKVQSAIFKVHRSVLAAYSTVLKDMLEIPSENGHKDGTDERPLVLIGDSAAGWEVLLGLQYDRYEVTQF
jgi:hypothetical protein